MFETPYFLDSVLPDRLSQIRHIQLCHNQKKEFPCCGSGTPAAERRHRFQKCALCNTSLWLDLIKKRMTGLRTVELFLYLSFHSMRLPTLDDPWIARLFGLQIGKNGLRDLKIHVCPNFESPFAFQQSMTAYRGNMETATRLNEMFQKRIDEGVEQYQGDTHHVEAAV